MASYPHMALPGRAPFTLFSYLCFAQGFYFSATGLWSLVSIVSFQAATGPKRDLWLVKTVGVLVIVIGAVLALSGYVRRTALLETAILAIGASAGLALIDIVYVALRQISVIYLLDAAAELVLILMWVLVWTRDRRRLAPSPGNP